MKATLCDRCGNAFFESTKRGERQYTLRRILQGTTNKQMSRGVKVDLCEACYAELINWFKNS